MGFLRPDRSEVHVQIDHIEVKGQIFNFSKSREKKLGVFVDSLFYPVAGNLEPWNRITSDFSVKYVSSYLWGGSRS